MEINQKQRFRTGNHFAHPSRDYMIKIEHFKMAKTRAHPARDVLGGSIFAKTPLKEILE